MNSIYTYLITILSKYCNHIKSNMTEKTRFLFTNIDIGAYGGKNGVSTFRRRISRLGAIWMVSMIIHCIIGIFMSLIMMNPCNHKNLYHFGDWFITTDASRKDYYYH